MGIKKLSLKSLILAGFAVPVFLAAHLAMLSTPVLAIDANLFNAGNIIDDPTFTNNASMTTAQIQDFLNAKNSTCLKNFSTLSLSDDNNNGRVEEGGSEPYGKHGNVSAAQVIKSAADIYKINPQVILVTLEKEQGLITRSDCPSWRYNTALGYACPDNADCNTAAFGFTRQIDYGVFHFRGFYDDSLNTVPFGVGNYRIYYNPDPNCGSSIVNIQNRATASLYSYTPYQPNAGSLAAGYGMASCGAYGNRNFWLYFNQWFGNSTGSFLLQSPSSSTVYLQSGTNRLSIPSGDVLRAYGFNSAKVTPVSDAYINSLIDKGVLTTTFTKEGDGAVYLADNGFKFAFTSAQQCIDWGFPNCTNTAYTKSLSQGLFDKLLNYGSLKSLMLNGSTVSLMSGGQKTPYLSTAAMAQAGYSNSDIIPITNPVNTSQPFTYSVPQENSLVSFGGNPTIYAYSQGKFYGIPTYDMYLSLSKLPLQIDNFSKYTITPPTAQATLQTVIAPGDGKTYVLNGGSKLDITTVTSNWPTPQAINISGITNQIPTTNVITNTTTFRSSAGMIFGVVGSKVRPYYSVSDYFALGNTSPLTIADSTIKTLQTGDYILAPGNGTLFKTTAQDEEYTIYTLSSNNTLCQVASQSQLGQFNFNTSGVYKINKPVGATNLLSSWVSDTAGNSYIIENGTKIPAPSGNLTSNWGINSPSSNCSFTSGFLSRFSNSNRAVNKFVQSNDGTIYYGNSGQKHVITTYEKFLGLGGNSGNTIKVPDSFISASPTGNPI